MKDYSAMSDYLINQHVAESLTGRYLYFPDYVWDSEEEKRFDPCNNPADAWPIIVGNEIALLSSWNEEGVWGATVSPWNSHEHTNPLRAAMIVYLQMNDK